MCSTKPPACRSAPLGWLIFAVAFGVAHPRIARGDEPQPAQVTTETAPAANTEASPAVPLTASSDEGSDALSDEAVNAPPSIRYYLERVEVRGNRHTRSSAVRHFVDLTPGSILDVDDPTIQALRFRLLGTGWFRDVRLSLRRGSTRGWVVLVIDVEERNTLVIQNFAAGIAEGVRRSSDTSSNLEPYAGLELTETNLFGLGMGLSAAALISNPQQGFRLRFNNPFFLGSSYALRVEAMFNNARDFFGGGDAQVSIQCPPPDPVDGTQPSCPDVVRAKNAVVIYRRYGLAIGTGVDVSRSTRITLDWRAEIVDVLAKPDAASEMRGGRTVPIDFAINDGVSFVSSAQIGVTYDRRDDPGRTTEGLYLNFRGDLGGAVLGSDYDFLRMQVLARHWSRLPWGHVLRLSAYAGVIFGSPPFFYKFYVSDLSDLIPSRMLELNLDRRPPPNLFRSLGVKGGTAIAEMRSEELAGRVDAEYSFPLHRSGHGIYAIDAYFNLGVYALADRNDLRVAIPGYTGLARVPLDLTFDLGIRMDTDVGLFQLGFSNVLGFITP